MTLLCLPVIGPSIEEVREQIQKSVLKADLLEWRLDFFKERDFEILQKIRQNLTVPVIFTLRKTSQGGNYVGSEEDRQKEIFKLAQLNPEYFDLEYDTSKNFATELKKQFPEIQQIISYHDFSSTSEDLESIYRKIKELPGSFYKIATMANSTNDSLRMLQFMSKYPQLLGMCMGEKGNLTRILGKMFGAPWIYACLSKNEQTANGQSTFDELTTHYQIQRLNQRTSIYGLIGNPIEKSLSHITHNTSFRQSYMNAVYVKMSVEPDELESFFFLIKTMPFHGLSITMPLKEEVIPFLTHLDKKAQAIGAVNTIVIKDSKLYGYNTDAEGALNAIEKFEPVKDKQVVVIGAGGAARAIAFEAKERGCQVFILNRTLEKAQHIANQLSVFFLEKIPTSYDILINATASSSPIPEEDIYPQSLVMDINAYPKMNAFMSNALKKGCLLVFGYEMFINQAIGQFRLWLPELAQILAQNLWDQASLFDEIEL